MRHKRAILRAAADRDVQEAIEFYLAEGAQRAALKFINAIEQALQDVERHPAIGSTRYAHELGLPELRCWHLKGYPHVDIWRVLHGSRDIPSWLYTAG